MNESLEKIKEVLLAVDAFLAAESELETPYGFQETSAGYELISLENLSNNCCIVLAYMKDRAIRENDVLRGGDQIGFRYYFKTKKIEQL